TDVSDEDVSAALGLPGFETLRAVFEAVADQDFQKNLRIVDMIVNRGDDIRNFFREGMTHVINILVVKGAGVVQELTQIAQSEAEWIASLADRFSDQDLIRFFSILSKTEQDIRVSSQPRFQLEIGLVKMAQSARLYLLEEAIDRMAAIQEQLRQENGTAPGAPLEPASHRKPLDSRRTSAIKPTRLRSDPLKVSRLLGPGLQPPTQRPGAGPPQDRDALPRRTPERNLRASGSQKSAGPPILPPEAEGATQQAAPAGPPITPALDHVSATPRSGPNEQSSTPIEQVKKVLERRSKIMLSIALERAEHVSIDGHYLVLKYAPP